MSISEPKVSVIIPLYNTADFIAQTLTSVLCQTMIDIEVIVVDDGSTDNGLQIVQGIAKRDERVIVVSQPNKGQAVARNAGFDCAKGKYLYFMDSDDLLKSDSLERCYIKCVENELDFLFFDAEIFGDSDGYFEPNYYVRTIGLEDRVYKGIDILKILLDRRGYRTPMWLNLINRDFLRRIELKSLPGMKHEDELFMVLSYLQADRVGFISETFFRRRVRSGSIMTSAVSERNIEDYFVVAVELRAYGLNKSRQICDIIDLFVARMLNAAVCKGYSLSFGYRLKIAVRCFFGYASSIKPKSLAVLLLKKHINHILRR